jgi:hypothetical protein
LQRSWHQHRAVLRAGHTGIRGYRHDGSLEGNHESGEVSGEGPAYGAPSSAVDCQCRLGAETLRRLASSRPALRLLNGNLGRWPTGSAWPWWQGERDGRHIRAFRQVRRFPVPDKATVDEAIASSEGCTTRAGAPGDIAPGMTMGTGTTARPGPPFQPAARCPGTRRRHRGTTKPVAYGHRQIDLNVAAYAAFPQYALSLRAGSE